MDKLNLAVGKIVLLIFEAAVGVVLLINPIGFATIFITIVGVLLAAAGLMFTLQYFRTEPSEAQKDQGLLKGCCALLVGLFCVLKTNWLIETIQLLTVVYGIVILFTGFIRIQWAADMLRLKVGRWYIAAGGAVVSSILAVIIFVNSAETIWVLVGISFLVNAVADMAVLIFSGKIAKDAGKREISIPEENSADAEKE